MKPARHPRARSAIRDRQVRGHLRAQIHDPQEGVKAPTTGDALHAHFARTARVFRKHLRTQVTAQQVCDTPYTVRHPAWQNKQC